MYVTANSFVRQMVRNLVGMLIEVSNNICYILLLLGMWKCLINLCYDAKLDRKRQANTSECFRYATSEE